MYRKLVFIIVLSIACSNLWGQFELDVECGAIFTGYNDVRIPGNSGTLFSLNKDLKTDVTPYWRNRLIYHFNSKHHISILYAPLTLEASGKLDENVIFQETVFPANTSLTSTYKFNSYRISYRYDFVRKKRVTVGMGFTAKIRDAIIRLENNEIKAEKKNVGFVPILNFKVSWMLDEKLSVVFEGDALAAPQGRAEDVALSANYQWNDRINFRIGYRLLEGGADNDEVYTFSLFHYAVLGLTYKF